MNNLWNKSQTNFIYMYNVQWSDTIAPVPENGIAFVGNWDVLVITYSFKVYHINSSTKSWEKIN